MITQPPELSAAKRRKGRKRRRTTPRQAIRSHASTRPPLFLSLAPFRRQSVEEIFRASMAKSAASRRGELEHEWYLARDGKWSGRSRWPRLQIPHSPRPTVINLSAHPVRLRRRGSPSCVSRTSASGKRAIRSSRPPNFSNDPPQGADLHVGLLLQVREARLTDPQRRGQLPLPLPDRLAQFQQRQFRHHLPRPPPGAVAVGAGHHAVRQIVEGFCHGSEV